MAEEEKDYIEATVDRLEERSVILRLPDAQELAWPIDRLPETVSPGTPVWLMLKTSRPKVNDQLSHKDFLNAIIHEEEVKS